MRAGLRSFWIAGLVAVNLLCAGLAGAADRARIEQFLSVTGFDVALDSMALGAEQAPAMLGRDPGEFGSLWKKLVQEVMVPADIRETAIGILQQTLDETSLDHALAFYGSDLGRRLVAAENAAHMEKGDDGKDEAGEAIIGALVRSGPEGRDRLDYFRRMNAAIDIGDMSIRALQEVQIRFLMAAARAGVIALKMDEPDLREMFREQEPQLRSALLASAMANAAYTYQSFSDDELHDYTLALEAEPMRQVYELMNAVHYEIMANRYEMLAARMAILRPSQEL
ncbi:DUF2059 domain-containing protein [Thalassovita sp.]|uniref:DUF2059 domain-containing protein n=1 Tax=Thalassovita sp. TaxID=1979401 RepID=UPI0029DE6944|nr:DUF2059 domain-containing protein [Thalassovita sp.]